jgi:hypothetical protein
MKTIKAMKSIYPLLPWTASEVVRLPAIPQTARGLYLVPPKTTQPTEVKARKTPVQAKVPVKVGDKSYQSICAMMKGEGIQDRAKEGLDNNWSKIRNSLKKTGACTWNFSKNHSITITQ